MPALSGRSHDGFCGGLPSDYFAVWSNFFSTLRGYCDDYRSFLFRQSYARTGLREQAIRQDLSLAGKMDDSPAGRELCPVSRQLGSTVNCPLSALTHQNRRAGRSAGGHCSYLPTTREQRKQVSGVVAPMSAPHYFEMKK